MSLHQNDDGSLDRLNETIMRSLRAWTKAPCCVDGWVPGEFGIERCDDCKRFECDDDAAAHVTHVISTLEANGYLASPVIHVDLYNEDEEEGDDE